MLKPQINWPRVPGPGFASAYIGVPWRWQGRCPTSGLDCWALVRYIWAANFGYNAPDYASVQEPGSPASRERQVREIIRAQTPNWVKLTRPELGAGVLMSPGGTPSHVGICLSSIDVLHACERKGSVVRERLTDLTVQGFYAPEAMVARP